MEYLSNMLYIAHRASFLSREPNCMIGRSESKIGVDRFTSCGSHHENFDGSLKSRPFLKSLLGGNKKDVDEVLRKKTTTSPKDN